MEAHTYISKIVKENNYVDWNSEENKTWSILFDRQFEIIQNRASNEFIMGLEILNFSENEVPQISDVNKILLDCTGWSVEPVPALIQPQEFFTLLANKKFPAATFIRIPKDLDYIQEPDIFHEIYGHTPLLTNKYYGDFMESFGKLALEAAPKDRRKLFRLFWFTIEFGLVKTDTGLRAYGGGILSSIGETQFCLSGEPIIKEFDILDVLRTPYRIDIMQPLYFVLNNFDDMFDIFDKDILKILDKANELGDFPPSFPKKMKPMALDVEPDDGDLKC